MKVVFSTWGVYSSIERCYLRITTSKIVLLRDHSYKQTQIQYGCSQVPHGHVGFEVDNHPLLVKRYDISEITKIKLTSFPLLKSTITCIHTPKAWMVWVNHAIDMFSMIFDVLQQPTHTVCMFLQCCNSSKTFLQPSVKNMSLFPKE